MSECCSSDPSSSHSDSNGNDGGGDAVISALSESRLPSLLPSFSATSKRGWMDAARLIRKTTYVPRDFKKASALRKRQPVRPHSSDGSNVSTKVIVRGQASLKKTPSGWSPW